MLVAPQCFIVIVNIDDLSQRTKGDKKSHCLQSFIILRPLKQKFFDKDVSEGKKYSSYLAFDNGSIFLIYGKSFSWKHFMTSSDTFKMANEWVQKRIVNYAVYINAMSTDNFIRKYCKYFQSFNFKHRRNILKHRNKETI